MHSQENSRHNVGSAAPRGVLVALLALIVASGLLAAAAFATHRRTGTVSAPRRSEKDPRPLRRRPTPAGRSGPSRRARTAAGASICGDGDQSWQQVSTTSSLEPSGFSAEQMQLLTNGTVMVQQSQTGNWFALTPDAKGCYGDGTWSKLASMPSGYGPTYAGSAVLKNGDVIVEGGEYNGAEEFTKKGALYSPFTNKWIEVAPPSKWGGGDVATANLPNGQLMMSNSSSGGAFVLNPNTLAWTSVPGGSEGDMDEQGWSLLPTGKLLTVDIGMAPGGVDLNSHNDSLTELYDPSTKTWSSAGYTPGIMWSACPRPSRLSGTGAGTLIPLSLSECPQQFHLDVGYSRAGATIGFLYFVTNYGSTKITGLSVSSDKTTVSCPSTTLEPGASVTCTGTYTTTASDLTNNECEREGKKVGCVIDSSTASGKAGEATLTSPKATEAPTVEAEGSENVYSISDIGPQVLRPDGTVFAEGASGYNVLYNVSTNSWSTSAAMDFPEILASEPAKCGETSSYTWQVARSLDNSSVVLPDGNVMTPGGAGNHCPLVYFEFNGTQLVQLPEQPPGAGSETNDAGAPFFLVLPTGQILSNHGSGNDMEIYTDTNPPESGWRPRVTSVTKTLSPGSTYTVNGTQLNGLTQASGYGDDFQDATDYPLVQITNNSSGDVSYATTFDFASMSIKPHNASAARFRLSSSTPAGASTLRVIANGIASEPVSVTVG